MSHHRYPLQWPVQYKRTTWPEKSKFQKPTLAASVKNIIREIERLDKRNFKETDVFISSNVPLKNDGYPRADYMKSIITDRGVAVYFKRNKQDVVLACDKYDTVESNMHAIYKTIEALRSIDRWGVSDFLNKSFTGFQALPERADAPAPKKWWDVLGFDYMPTSPYDARQAFIKLSMSNHPDRGGDNSRQQAINQAWEEAKKHFNII